MKSKILIIGGVRIPVSDDIGMMSVHGKVVNVESSGQFLSPNPRVVLGHEAHIHFKLTQGAKPGVGGLPRNAAGKTELEATYHQDWLPQADPRPETREFKYGEWSMTLPAAEHDPLYSWSENVEERILETTENTEATGAELTALIFSEAEDRVLWVEDNREEILNLLRDIDGAATAIREELDRLGKELSALESRKGELQVVVDAPSGVDRIGRITREAANKEIQTLPKQIAALQEQIEALKQYGAHEVRRIELALQPAIDLYHEQLEEAEAAIKELLGVTELPKGVTLPARIPELNLEGEVLERESILHQVEPPEDDTEEA